MTHLAAPELLAEMAERRMTAGRNRPMTVFARKAAPESPLVHCVVKPRGRLTMPPVEYLCEWLASGLARALGLDTPSPHLVRIDSAFAGAVVDAELRADLETSLGLVFGSEYVAGDYTQYADGLALSSEQREAAARVLAFDAFVHNPDRRHDNPNLFVNRRGFLVFDHEQAFSFLVPVIGSGPPETDPALDIVERHVFRHVFGRGGPDFGGFRSALQGLADSSLDELARSTPSEWTHGTAQGKILKIMQVLRARRDALDSWLPLIEARVTT